MLTGRRLRERAAAEASGQPLPPPRRPQADVPRHQHEAELAALRKAHAQELATVRAELEQARAENAELKDQHEAELAALTAPSSDVEPKDPEGPAEGEPGGPKGSGAGAPDKPQAKPEPEKPKGKKSR